jgi:hypothetical protein
MTKRNISKPRNHVVLALLKTKRKAGKHEKTHKAERRADKVKTCRKKVNCKLLRNVI